MDSLVQIEVFMNGPSQLLAAVLAETRVAARVFVNHVQGVQKFTIGQKIRQPVLTRRLSPVPSKSFVSPQNMVPGQTLCARRQPFVEILCCCFMAASRLR